MSNFSVYRKNMNLLINLWDEHICLVDPCVVVAICCDFRVNWKAFSLYIESTPAACRGPVIHKPTSYAQVCAIEEFCATVFNL